MRFRDYFSNDFETGENHYLPELRTRYYKVRNEEAKETIKRLIDVEKGKLKAISEVHNEVFYQTAEYSCIATIISTKPTETAIDFKVTTNSMLPLGKGKKVITRLYEYLDKKIPFKGVALNRN